MSGSILERVSVVLEVIRAAGRPLTLSDVTRRTELPRSTVHRILEQLARMGWLTRHGGHYALGSSLFELGMGAAQSDKLMTSAWPILQELYRDTGHAAFLGVLRDDEVVILQQAGGRRAATLPFRVGSRINANRASMGKVLLSMAPAQPRPDAAVPASARFREELARAQETGVAYSRDELVPGLSCIGAPIRAYGRPTGAAVSICGPTAQVQHRSLTSAVQAAAAAVGRAIEAPGCTKSLDRAPLGAIDHWAAPRGPRSACRSRTQHAAPALA